MLRASYAFRALPTAHITLPRLPSSSRLLLLASPTVARLVPPKVRSAVPPVPLPSRALCFPAAARTSHRPAARARLPFIAARPALPQSAHLLHPPPPLLSYSSSPHYPTTLFPRGAPHLSSLYTSTLYSTPSNYPSAQSAPSPSSPLSLPSPPNVTLSFASLLSSTTAAGCRPCSVPLLIKTYPSTPSAPSPSSSSPLSLHSPPHLTLSSASLLSSTAAAGCRPCFVAVLLSHSFPPPCPYSSSSFVSPHLLHCSPLPLMAPTLALTSLPLRFRPHPPPAVPPLLPLTSLPSASFAASFSPCTTSPTCRWTPPLLHPSAWIPLSHLRRRSSAVVTSGIGSLASIFCVTMPSQDSILGASPLMDPCFVVPFSPPLHSIVSHSPSPTAAALSLSRTLDFVLDSATIDSVFRDAGVLRNFPRPLSIDGAGETMTMICTCPSSLPCLSSPSGVVIGLYVPSCRHNLLFLTALQHVERSSPQVKSIAIFITTTGTSLVSPFLLLLASTPFVFPSPHLSITLPLLLPLPSPLATAKLSQSPHPSSPSASPKPLDLVHMDLWGPSPIASRQGHLYFLLVVDDHSRFATVYPLRAKSGTPTLIIRWAEQACLHFGRPVARLHSDGVCEFFNRSLSLFLLLLSWHSPNLHPSAFS
ncbi:unnamed protein product [Closterium sp. NIES-53]